MIRRPPRSPLFPYPPLFRSHAAATLHPPDPRAEQHVGLPDLIAEFGLKLLVRRWGEQLLFRKAALFEEDRKSTRLNSSHGYISYAVFCLKKKNTNNYNRCTI